MNSLSTLPRGGQHELRTETLRFPGPDVIPFDAAGDDGPDDCPSGPAAVGLPCRKGGVLETGPAYTLCVAIIKPDPGYPTDTDDPDYIEDGQEMLHFDDFDAAREAAQKFAGHPERLPRIDVHAVTHLVVNHRTGREVYRKAFSLRRAG